MRRKQVRFFVAMPMLAFAASGAYPQSISDLRCISLERASGCGCSLKIVAQSCVPPAHKGGGLVHFFSELYQGAPLLMDLQGQDLSLASRAPVSSSSFLHEKGDSWQDRYQTEDLSVSIQYHPRPSTCHPEKEKEEGCEYFDVAAEVEIAFQGERSKRYQATGACGC